MCTEYWWNNIDEKTEVLTEKLVSVPHFSPKIPKEMVCDRTHSLCSGKTVTNQVNFCNYYSVVVGPAVITYRCTGKTNTKESGLVLFYSCTHIEKSTTDIRAQFCLNERKTDTKHENYAEGTEG
jgi:hypothetical protein